MRVFGRSGIRSAGLLAGIALLFGCHTDMWAQPRQRPLSQADQSLFLDSSSARPLPAGTVARGFERADTEYFTGRDDQGKLIKTIPLDKVIAEMRKIDPKISSAQDVLIRGQEEFNAFCSPCHGRVGDGKGMIATRGLDLKRKPANYHDKKIREMPDGHYFDVITNGFGVMFPYGPRIQPQDRWAIVSYIRALQLSQQNARTGSNPGKEGPPGGL